MFRRFRLVGVGLLVAGVAAIAMACGDDDDGSDDAADGGGAAATSQITVEDAWARNSPAGAMGGPAMGGPAMGGMAPTQAPGMAKDRGAAYMKITNTGHAGDALIGASSAASAVTEIHESAMDGDQVTMRPVERIAVPVGETVELKPGGYHVMFIELNDKLSVGSTIQVELTFERAGKIIVDVEVRES